ncbi:MAG: hypothetical protein IH870_03365 [Chloroflexi bacterium]|nr:hypothetical protein [Chloroflexota bacterium]
MTIYGEPRVWLEEFPLGEPQAFAHDYLGLRYPGEVIRANSWDPVWGEPLTGELYFRIVLLLRRQGAPTARRSEVHDARIAVCTPGAGVSRQRGRLTGELTTIRETQALYLTQRDAETELIRTTLRRRQEGLEQQLMSEESLRYSSGSVVSGPERVAYPGNPFVGMDPIGWFGSIAGWLLSEAYQSRPIQSVELPRPFTPEDAAPLFAALFQQSGAAPEVLPEVLSDFGPGLELLQSPESLEPRGNPVAELIADYLETSPVPAPWQALHHYLAHQVGLTGPLATLHLLLFLHREKPELEVRLAADYQPALLGGEILFGSRITSDLVPVLAWDPQLSEGATTIGPITDPNWNDTLTYISLINPDLHPVAPGESPSLQESQLRDGIDDLVQQAAEGTQFLNLLLGRADRGDLAGRDLAIAESLSRLSGLGGAGFVQSYQALRAVYLSPADLASDLGILRRLSRLSQNSQLLQHVWAYLDDAPTSERLSASWPELALEIQALRATMLPASLLRFAESWDALSHQISRFKSSYAAAYLGHHRAIQQQLPDYQRGLEDGRLKLRALELLNTLPDLAPPLGEGLSDTLRDWGTDLAQCARQQPELEEELRDHPRCSGCGLALDQVLSLDDLQRTIRAIEFELDAQSRRLSNLLVEKIMRGERDQRLEDLLKIIQASDLSALCNTLSPELVGFIGQILR